MEINLPIKKTKSVKKINESEKSEIRAVQSGTGGNTNSPVPPNEKKKNVQGTQRINWFFTFNNYENEDIERLETRFRVICKRYIFQEEKGESGTPHLQGCIELKTRMRWSEFKLNPTIHWEPTKDKLASWKYCQKDETRSGGVYEWPMKAKLKVIDSLKPFQQKIVDIVTSEPDDRTIHWIWDKEGNNGKTVLCKYLVHMYQSIICTGGRYEDIACMLAMEVKNDRDLNEKFSFIMNIPRDVKNVSYKGLESVKDGLITSSKYESSTLVFNSPHVIVFSNSEPDYEKLSSDRWKVYNIENDDLILIK